MRTWSAVVPFVLCITLVAPARADVTIGAFSNSGTSCSFANSPGLVTAHIVVRADTPGIRGVRFAAPIPSCFDAVFVGETTPDGLFSIGESQTGISIAIPGCTDLPTRVLDITYYSAGGTTPCCEFPLVADPFVGYLEAVDCGYASIPMQALTSTMNADSTCVCSVPETPPYPPANPYPADGMISVGRTVVLQWTASDPFGRDVTCDLYFGTTPNPPLFASDIVGYGAWSYALPRLAYETVYYWKVVARNLGGAETTGPVWQFTTGPNPPPVVTLTSPADNAASVDFPVLLKWTGTDSSPITYDVFLGTDPLSLARVATGLTTTQHSVPSLPYSTKHYWRIAGIDADGAQGTSATWSFTTRPSNRPPDAPFSPSPANNATNVSITPSMAWAGSDPDGQPLTFDVYLGTSADPPLVATNVRVPYRPSLQMQTKYYWRVVARDPFGLTTSGPVWNFTTRVNSPPAVPSNPTPANGAVGQPLNTILSWTCSDADGHALTYDVYFGTVSPPPLVSGSRASANYDPGPQSFQTLYYWRVVARDALGAETAGPTWSYTAKAENEPPTFVSATPADVAGNVPTTAALQWNFVDPEGQPLNFDVYFGTDTSPPLVADHITATSYTPGPLATLTYYWWKVVARDPAGNERSMAVRSFITTRFSGSPPNVPSNPSPPDHGTANSSTPLLSWQGGDPDGDPLTYTVFMTLHDASLIYLGATTTPSFQVQEFLDPGRVYSWYVVASEAQWSTQGPLWSFTVTGGNIPVAFKSFDAEQNGNAVDVSWELASDEAMESFTLYRRANGAQVAEIAHGRVERESDSYRDAMVEPGATYAYELVVRTSDGDEFRSPVATVAVARLELTLHQNVPNPFNPQTSIRYELPAPSHVRLMVFDVNGRLVRTLVDEDREVGAHEATWTGRDDAGRPVTSGVYFYVLEAGKERLTRKLVLLK